MAQPLKGKRFNFPPLAGEIEGGDKMTCTLSGYEPDPILERHNIIQTFGGGVSAFVPELSARSAPPNSSTSLA
jgi:hypothetical protein